jgi:hypothetical protein
MIALAEPVVPSPSGGTIKVRTANIAVWRLSGHRKGDRVERIGWISVGDLVYK